MNLSILIDEDLHRSIASVFKALGFMVFDVHDVGMRGAADEYIFKWAQKNDCIIVSSDLGFSNQLKFPKHKGMIILRFPNEIPTEVINKEVARLLKELTEDDYKSALIIVSPNKIRLKSIQEIKSVKKLEGFSPFFCIKEKANTMGWVELHTFY